MNIKNNILELIGNTPLLNISKFYEDLNLNNNVYAKVELFNPTGSVKDRAAYYMIKGAIESGKLKEGGTIIEATSGNTGIGLASIATVYNLKAIIVMPETMSVERRKIIAAYGAEIVLTEGAKGMAGAIEKAKEINDSTENSFIVSQFDNPDNVKAHIETTAVELLRDTDEKIDYLFAGFGTGGTITGIGKVLKEKITNVKVIGIEPDGSPVISRGQKGSHKIQGIGAGFKPDNLDTSVVDYVETVKDADAFKETNSFAKKMGLMIGISSGAAISGSKAYLKENNIQNKNIVVILPDSGDRYLSVENLF